MDADRFDTWAKQLGTPATRRAALRTSVAGGVLGALGLSRAVPEASAAQGGTCVVAFTAQVRQGPSSTQPLVPNGGSAGAVQGNLSFTLSRSGSLDNATLTLADGTNLPVVGDATGHSLQLRIALGQQRALVAVGVGEQEIAQCLGAIDGVVAGPQSGDLGDWHAAAGVQNIPSGGQVSDNAKQRKAKAGAAGATAGAGSDGTGRTGRAGRGDRGATGAAGDAGQGNAAGTGGNPACPSGETYCAYVEECRDLRTSPLDCGACGTRCPSLVCQEGRCLSEEEADAAGSGGGMQNCAPPFSVCGDACVDTSSDPANCGGCGVVCAADQVCTNGTCSATQGTSGQQTCAAGLTDCGGACVDLANDRLNCGVCGVICDDGCCGGRCVHLDAEANCGACGVVCDEGQICIDGSCFTPGGGCTGGLTDCGGTCVDLQTNDFHCGGCMLGCAGDQTCQSGTCVANAPVCDAGLTDCGGTCVDLSSDTANCGVCGNTCTPTGVGAPNCCSGRCADLLTDATSCGACGIFCPAGVPCSGGVCISP